MGEYTAVLGPVIALFLLGLGYFAGKWAETRHYRSIHAREAGFLTTPAVTTKTLGDPRPVRQTQLAVGSVVISVDHFKRFLMGFRRIFGGEVRSYSSLIDRGRREAILRMKEAAPGADLFLNCRLETSTISNGQGNATGCFEVVAYGTAIQFFDEVRPEEA